jgi:hypothetical protein
MSKETKMEVDTSTTTSKTETKSPQDEDLIRKRNNWYKNLVNTDCNKIRKDKRPVFQAQRKKQSQFSFSLDESTAMFE